MTAVKNTDVQSRGGPRFFGRETMREVVVVVASILIAFSLDAWWDGVTKDRELRQQLRGVVAELEAGRLQLEESVLSHTVLGSAALSLRARLREVPLGDPVSVSDTLVGALFSHFQMDVGMSATTRFIEDGGLELLERPEVASALRDWPAVMVDATDDQAQLRSGVQAGYQNYMMSAGTLGDAPRAGSDMVRRAHSAARGGEIPPFRAPPREVTLRATPELLNLLSWRIANEETRQRQMEGLLRAQDSLIVAIRAALD